MSNTVVKQSGITSFSFVYSICSLFLLSLSRLKSDFFLELKCAEGASVWLTPQEALYKCLYSTQYNTIQPKLGIVLYL